MLYVGGLLLDIVWPGTILPFYGAMFVIAAALFTLALGMGAGGRARRRARPAPACAGGRSQSSLDGDDTSWFFAPIVERPWTGSPTSAVNGTHPLLPWLAFFCTGIVLGRLLHTDWWRPIALGVGFTLFGGASVISSSIAPGPLASPLSSTDPFDRGLLYTASALGTALIAFGVDLVAGRPLRRDDARPSCCATPGAMTLTLYVAHALVFNLVVDWLGWVRPDRARHGARRSPPSTGSSPSRSPRGTTAASASARSSGCTAARRVTLLISRLATARRTCRSALGSPVSKPRRNHGTRCSDEPWVQCLGVDPALRLLLDAVVADGRPRRSAPRRSRRARAGRAARRRGPTHRRSSRPAARGRPSTGWLRPGSCCCGSADLVADAEDVLHVVAVLVGDDVLRGEVAGGAELLLQLLQELEVEVHEPVGRAVERADLRRGLAARRCS